MEVQISNLKFDELVFNNVSNNLKQKYNNVTTWRNLNSFYMRKKTIVKFCKTIGLAFSYVGDDTYWFEVIDDKKYAFAKLLHGV